MANPTSNDQIKVAIRVRPPISREIKAQSSARWTIKDGQICAIQPDNQERYVFDCIFDQECTNSDLYTAVAQPIVMDVMKGINGTVFAYGQTASGKTHTMMGSPSQPGLVPQIAHEVFKFIEQTEDREFLIRCSYMEIYNEDITDLLTGSKNLKIREVAVADGRETRVASLHETMVKTPHDILKSISIGEARRRTGATEMNDKSSRSHTIFKMIVESRERATQDEPDLAVNVAQLNLVDLAGSEKVAQTGAAGDRFKEGCAINLSLLALSRCINRLAEMADFIPYRESKLTRILQNSLGGNSKTAVICNISPMALEETISTLRFASSAKKISNKPTVNEVVSDEALLRKLQKLTKVQETEQMNLQRQLAEKTQKELELEKQVENLKNFICVSTTSHDFGKAASQAAQRKLRRETWCPGKSAAAAGPARLGPMSGYGPPPPPFSIPEFRPLAAAAATDMMIPEKIEEEPAITEELKHLKRRSADTAMVSRRKRKPRASDATIKCGSVLHEINENFPGKMAQPSFQDMSIGKELLTAETYKEMFGSTGDLDVDQKGEPSTEADKVTDTMEVDVTEGGEDGGASVAITEDKSMALVHTNQMLVEKVKRLEEELSRAKQQANTESPATPVAGQGDNQFCMDLVNLDQSGLSETTSRKNSMVAPGAPQTGDLLGLNMDGRSNCDKVFFLEAQLDSLEATVRDHESTHTSLEEQIIASVKLAKTSMDRAQAAESHLQSLQYELALSREESQLLKNLLSTKEQELDDQEEFNRLEKEFALFSSDLSDFSKCSDSTPPLAGRPSLGPAGASTSRRLSVCATPNNMSSLAARRLSMCPTTPARSRVKIQKLEADLDQVSKDLEKQREETEAKSAEWKSILVAESDIQQEAVKKAAQKMKAAQKSVNELTIEKEALEKVKDDLENRCSSLEKKLENAQLTAPDPDEITKLEGEKNELNEKAQQSADQLLELTHKCESLANQCQALEAKCADTDKERVELTEICDDVTKMRDDLMSKYTNIVKEKEDLARASARAEERYSVSEQKCSVIEEELSVATGNLAAAEERCVHAEEKLANTDGKLTVVEEKLSIGERQLVTTEEKLTTTEEKLSTTEEMLTTTKEKLATTEEKLSTTEDKLTTMEDKLSTTEDKLTTAEETLATTDETLATTDEKLTTTEEKLATMEEKLTTTEEKLSTTEDKLTTTEETLATTKEKLTTTEEKLTTTEEKLATTEEKLTTTEEKLATTEERLATTDAKLTTTEENLATTDGKLTVTEDKLATEEQKSSTSGGRLACVEEECLLLTTKCAEAEQKCLTLEGNLNLFEAGNSSPVPENGLLVEKLQALSSSHAVLGGDYRTLNKENDDLLEKHGELCQEHDSLQKEHSLLQKEYTSVQSERECLQRESAKEVTSIQDELSLLRGEHVLLQDEFTTLQNEHSSLQNEHSSLQNEYSSLQCESKSFHEEQKVLKQEVTSIQGELSFLRGEHALLQDEFTTLQNEHSSLQTEHSSLQNEYSSLQCESKSLHEEHTELEQKVLKQDTSIQGELSLLRGEDELSQAKFSTLQNEYSLLQNEHTSLRNEHQLLHNKLEITEKEHGSNGTESRESYNALYEEHDQLKFEHSSLQDNFDSLLEEYTSLQRQCASISQNDGGVSAVEPQEESFPMVEHQQGAVQSVMEAILDTVEVNCVVDSKQAECETISGEHSAQLTALQEEHTALQGEQASLLEKYTEMKGRFEELQAHLPGMVSELNQTPTGKPSTSPVRQLNMDREVGLERPNEPATGCVSTFVEPFAVAAVTEDAMIAHEAHEAMAGLFSSVEFADLAVTHQHLLDEHASLKGEYNTLLSDYGALEGEHKKTVIEMRSDHLSSGNEQCSRLERSRSVHTSESGDDGASSPLPMDEIRSITADLQRLHSDLRMESKAKSMLKTFKRKLSSHFGARFTEEMDEEVDTPVKRVRLGENVCNVESEVCAETTCDVEGEVPAEASFEELENRNKMSPAAGSRLDANTEALTVEVGALGAQRGVLTTNLTLTEQIELSKKEKDYFETELDILRRQYTSLKYEKEANDVQLTELNCEKEDIISTLEAQKEERDAENEALSNQMDVLSTQNAKLESQIRCMEALCESTEADRTSVTTQLDEFTTTKIDLEARIASMEVYSGQTEAEKTALGNQLTELISQNESLEARVSELVLRQESVISEKEFLGVQLLEATRQKEDFGARICQMEALVASNGVAMKGAFVELEDVKAMNGKLESENQCLEERCAGMVNSDQVLELLQGNKELTSKIEAAEEQTVAAESEKTVLISKMADLECANVGYLTEIKALEATIESFKATMSQLTEMTEENERVTADKNELGKQIKTMEEEKEALLVRASDLLKEQQVLVAAHNEAIAAARDIAVQALSADRDERAEDVKHLKEKLASTVKSKESLQAEHEACSEKVTKLEGTIQAMGDIVEQAREEADKERTALLEKIDVLTCNRVNLEGTIHTMGDTVDQAREEAEKERTALLGKLDVLTCNRANLEDELQQALEEVSTLKAEHAQCSGSLAMLTSQLESSKMAESELSATYEESKSAVESLEKQLVTAIEKEKSVLNKYELMESTRKGLLEEMEAMRKELLATQDSQEGLATQSTVDGTEEDIIPSSQHVTASSNVSPVGVRCSSRLATRSGRQPAGEKDLDTSAEKEDVAVTDLKSRNSRLKKRCEALEAMCVGMESALAGGRVAEKSSRSAQLAAEGRFGEVEAALADKVVALAEAQRALEEATSKLESVQELLNVAEMRVKASERALGEKEKECKDLVDRRRETGDTSKTEEIGGEKGKLSVLERKYRAAKLVVQDQRCLRKDAESTRLKLEAANQSLEKQVAELRAESEKRHLAVAAASSSPHIQSRVKQESDSAVKERDELVQERDAVVIERNSAVKERDALHGELQSLVKEELSEAEAGDTKKYTLPTLQAKYRRLQKIAKSQHGVAEHLAKVKKSLIQQLETLQANPEGYFREELEGVREENRKLEQEIRDADEECEELQGELQVYKIDEEQVKEDRRNLNLLKEEAVRLKCEISGKEGQLIELQQLKKEIRKLEDELFESEKKRFALSESVRSLEKTLHKEVGGSQPATPTSRVNQVEYERLQIENGHLKRQLRRNVAKTQLQTSQAANASAVSLTPACITTPANPPNTGRADRSSLLQHRLVGLMPATRFSARLQDTVTEPVDVTVNNTMDRSIGPSVPASIENSTQKRTAAATLRDEGSDKSVGRSPLRDTKNDGSRTRRSQTSGTKRQAVLASQSGEAIEVMADQKKKIKSEKIASTHSKDQATHQSQRVLRSTAAAENTEDITECNTQ